MPIFLNLLRNPYAIGVLAVILVGGIQQARVWKAHAEISALTADMSQQQQRWAEASRAGHKAAQDALQAAILREREMAEARQAATAEAALRLREAARVAQREAEEWRARYREAVASDPDCKAWSQSRVMCPL